MTQADTSTAALDRLRERLAWHVELSQKLHRPCSADCLNEARKMIDALAAERDEAIDQRNASDFVLALALKMSERRSAERDAHRDAHAAAQNVLNALYCERDRLREALREIVEAWDWWQQDTSDRCQSVPSEAIARARAALGDPGHD